MAASPALTLAILVITGYWFTACTAYSPITNQVRLSVDKELIGLTKLLIRWDGLVQYDETEHKPNTSIIHNFLENIPDYDDEYYTTHPVGVFILTQRLVIGWPKMIDVMRQHKHFTGAFKVRVDYLMTYLPTDGDVQMALTSVLQLQTMYEWSADHVADGRLPRGVKVPADTCFQIAEAAEDLQYSYYSIQWYQRAVESYEADRHVGSVLRAKSRLAAMFYKVRRLDDAILLARQVVDTDPSNSLAEQNLHFYERLQREGALSPPDDIRPKPSTKRLRRLTSDVCTGQLQRRFPLDCSYLHFNPMERIGTEIIRTNPPIVMYHNVLSANSSRDLKEAVQQKLEDTMFNSAANIHHNWARVTGDNQQVRQIDQMLMRISNRSVESSKSDFTAISHGTAVRNDNLVDLKQIQQRGQNTSTLMVFLDDVTEGGEMVFPYLKIRITPTVGAAVFWRNTKDDGKMDRRLRWGECPVIRGSKMVIYKIYHNQEPNENEDEDEEH